MASYLVELASVMAVFALVIISPGADFAMVIRQSLVSGRRASILTSFGIGASLLMHISYTILGLGLVISQSILAFSILKWLGAAYLIYIGIVSLRSKGIAAPEPGTPVTIHRQSAFKAFGLGFAANALNPKPVFFFLSVFSTLVSHETPDLVKFSYGLVMAMALVGWFVAVSLFMTTPSVRTRFARISKWIDRVSGAVFIGFGLKLAAEKAG